MIGASSLRTRRGSGIYQTGRDRVVQILETALDILIEDGYQALSLREVARRCKVQIGAISYYYKSRSDLLRDVLNMVLAPYGENFKAIRHAPGLTPEEKLEKLITLLLEDIQTKKTTRLFPHLWMLANHDPFVAKAVDTIYILERLTFASLIAKINPQLVEEERETLAVFISAAIAGSTMFIGFEKPWSKGLPLYRAMTCRALIDLVCTITPEQLAAYGWRREDLEPGWRTPTILSEDEHADLIASVRAESADAAHAKGTQKRAAG